MIERTFECRVRAPLEAVWEFHSSAKALDVLTPPGRKLTPMTDDLEVRNGALHVFRVSLGPVSMVWKARISEVNPPHCFVDTAEASPFAAWSHRHEFFADGDETIVRDTIRYRMPFGPLGAIAHALFAKRDLEKLFAFRHAATKRALESAPK